MKTIILFIVATLFILPICTYAQAPDTLWTRTYGLSGDDEAWQIKQTPDGGYVIVGSTGYPQDILLIKIDNNGDTIWTKSFDYSTEDVGRSVDILDDGGYVIAGHTAAQIVLMRTDSLGNYLWHRTLYTGSGRSVRVTGDGGFIVAGYTFVSGQGEDIYIAKTNNNGEPIWIKTYGGRENERAWDLQETIDGGFIIVGWTESFGYGESDIYVIKTDANGDSVWTRTYGNDRQNEGRSILLKNDGGFMFCGKKEADIFVVNTNSSGGIIWENTYSTGGVSVANSICSPIDGKYVLVASSRDLMTLIISSVIIKINIFGDSLWSTIIENPNHNHYCRSILQDLGGSLVTAGYRRMPSYNNDVFLCKFAPEITGIDDEIASMPEKITLRQNCPNPFNANTTISFTLTEPQDINLTVYDLLGRKVEVLLDELTNAGTHHVDFNSDDYPSGVYFYRLKTENYSDTKRMALIK